MKFMERGVLFYSRKGWKKKRNGWIKKVKNDEETKMMVRTFFWLRYWTWFYFKIVILYAFVTFIIAFFFSFKHIWFISNVEMDEIVTLNATNSDLIDRLFTNTSFAYRLWHRLDVTNLRHIFYLVSPNETIVQNWEDVPNYNIEVSAWWMTLIFLEFVVLRFSGHEDRYSLNDSITSICAGMCSQMFK